MKFILITLLLSTCHLCLGKTETNGTRPSPSTTIKSTYTTRDLIRDLITSLTSDGTSNSTSPSSLKPFQRDVKASTSTVSLLSYGNLALLGAVVLGGLAYVAPTLLPDYRRRAGPMPPMHPVYPHRFFDSLSDFSADMIPYLENEIAHQQGHHFYKRNKRSALRTNEVGAGGNSVDLGENVELSANEERLNIHDFLSKRFMAVSETIMVYVERTLDSVPYLPRLEAQACMERCICEAHNQPKKYGLPGLVLQLFFPPYSEAHSKSNKYSTISKYQLAAQYGRKEKANCHEQYSDCIVNFLDIIQKITHFFI